MTIQCKWMAVHYEKGNRCVNPCNIYFKLEKILSKYVSLIGAVMVVVMIKTQFSYNQISLSIWTAWKVGLPQQNKDKVIQFKYQEIDHSCLIEVFSYLTYTLAQNLSNSLHVKLSGILWWYKWDKSVTI